MLEFKFSSLLLDIYHIAMVDTDYENYAAYVECNGDFSRNFPVISSTTLDLGQDKVAMLSSEGE